MDKNTITGFDSSTSWVNCTPDVTWVRELTERKRWKETGQPDATEDESDAAWQSAHARLCQEITVAVSAYNEMVGSKQVVSAVAPNGDITLAKAAYPAGVLEVCFDRATARIHITARLRQSAGAAEDTHMIAAGWVVRNDVMHFTWFGAETPPGEIVRRFLTPFFDEI